MTSMCTASLRGTVILSGGDCERSCFLNPTCSLSSLGVAAFRNLRPQQVMLREDFLAKGCHDGGF